MNKILSNQPLFIFVTVDVLYILFLSMLEFIKLAILKILLAVKY